MASLSDVSADAGVLVPDVAFAYLEAGEGVSEKDAIFLLCHLEKTACSRFLARYRVPETAYADNAIISLLRAERTSRNDSLAERLSLPEVRPSGGYKRSRPMSVNVPEGAPFTHDKTLVARWRELFAWHLYQEKCGYARSPLFRGMIQRVYRSCMHVVRNVNDSNRLLTIITALKELAAGTTYTMSPFRDEVRGDEERFVERYERLTADKDEGGLDEAPPAPAWDDAVSEEEEEGEGEWAMAG